MIKKITIVHVGDFLGYPPVISLIENLLNNAIDVDLISSSDRGNIARKLLNNPSFGYIQVKLLKAKTPIHKIVNVFKNRKNFQEAVEKSMQNSDLLWTTTDLTVKMLGDQLLKYKHVMQLMELVQRMPLFLRTRFFDFPLSKYAQAAHKVVVPDMDRAYIQQAWWDLPNVPTVLPNKPYTISPLELSEDTKISLKKIKKEKRKILLYSGFIGKDRNILDFAEAIEKRDDYCLYILGRISDTDTDFKQDLENFSNVEYLGYHTAPSHLEFIKYAHIGLTPYVPIKSDLHPEINALYCAPNKIYEYSAFGVPMIGTNVLGLLRPFEQYGIGRCSESMLPESILKCIEYIEVHHEEMSQNCYKFFEKDDLDQIVKDIIN
ncbi:hypothetical protein [Streptococcus danieliae]|uniref:hypothetical protein n=1 Tax=Streptococcus danieliae TaxID=747656 RepID=UPI0021C80135|nr:hypothetical protein [Streptococcus danieliae]MCU0082030.1 hypothetical protein [Streptococcus danieliae]